MSLLSSISSVFKGASAIFGLGDVAAGVIGAGALIEAKGAREDAAAIAGAYRDSAAFDQAELEAEAAFTLEQAGVQARLVRERGARFRSQQLAAYGASGVRLDVGSPLEVMAQSAEDSALEAASLEMAAGFRADALQRQGRQTVKEAEARASGAQIAGRRGAVSSLLDAGVDIATLAAKLGG